MTIVNIARDLLALKPEYRKWVVAAAGFVGQAVNLGVFTGAVQRDLVIVLSLLTAVGVRAVSNGSAATPPAA